MKMYYYVKKNNNNSKYSSQGKSGKGSDDAGAHSFCSRCGVHFLHAPNSRSSALDVNVDCLYRDDSSVQIKVRPGKKTNLSSGTPLLGQWDEEIEGGINRYPATISEETSSMGLLPRQTSPFSAYQHHLLTKRSSDHYQDWGSVGGETFDINDDYSNVDAMPARWRKNHPSTPSTVYTSSQTESLLSGGVPPTLTLDTTTYNDAESVISLSSAKASVMGTATTTGSSTRTNPTTFEELPSPQNGPSPSTTPLVRHQLSFYMRKHMASVSADSSSPAKNVKAETIPLVQDEAATL